jgi:uncharacterized repeat protein (TIGR03803 family)
MKARLALIVCFALFTISAYAASTQPIVAFTFGCKGNAALRIGTCPNGGRPDSLVQGANGNFYGTAQVSQEGSSAPTGGAVFSLTPTGTFKLLHTFSPGPSKNYPNGNLPGLLTEGPDAKLYGETLFGGNGGCNGYCGNGVLYRVNEDGTGFQIIHKYCSESNCTDGAAGGVLVAGTDGNLYATSYSGGANGYGTIFRVIPSTGAFEIVVNFDATTGADPSGLVVASDGTFYGTSFGNKGAMLFHYIEATGTLQTFPAPFPTFNGLPSNGAIMAQGTNGHFYGLYHIYAKSGEGLFEVNPDGSNLTLFPFYTTQTGAGDPLQMILASDGNFYVDNYNGKSGYGSITKLSPSTGKALQTFAPFGANAAVGAYPAQIIQVKDGTFWGTTGQYGNVPSGFFADGTVFNLNLGLPPR